MSSIRTPYIYSHLKEFDSAVTTGNSWERSKIPEYIKTHGVESILDSYYRLTPLTAAAYHHNLEAAKILLEHNANVNSTTNAYTPLAYALSPCHTEKSCIPMALLFIKKGANINRNSIDTVLGSDLDASDIGKLIKNLRLLQKSKDPKEQSSIHLELSRLFNLLDDKESGLYHLGKHKALDPKFASHYSHVISPFKKPEKKEEKSQDLSLIDKEFKELSEAQKLIDTDKIKEYYKDLSALPESFDETVFTNLIKAFHDHGYTPELSSFEPHHQIRYVEYCKENNLAYVPVEQLEKNAWYENLKTALSHPAIQSKFAIPIYFRLLENKNLAHEVKIVVWFKLANALVHEASSGNGTYDKAIEYYKLCLAHPLTPMMGHHISFMLAWLMNDIPGDQHKRELLELIVNYYKNAKQKPEHVLLHLNAFLKNDSYKAIHDYLKIALAKCYASQNETEKAINLYNEVQMAAPRQEISAELQTLTQRLQTSQVLQTAQDAKAQFQAALQSAETAKGNLSNDESITLLLPVINKALQTMDSKAINAAWQHVKKFFAERYLAGEPLADAVIKLIFPFLLHDDAENFIKKNKSHAKEIIAFVNSKQLFTPTFMQCIDRNNKAFIIRMENYTNYFDYFVAEFRHVDSIIGDLGPLRKLALSNNLLAIRALLQVEGRFRAKILLGACFILLNNNEEIRKKFTLLPGVDVRLTEVETTVYGKLQTFAQQKVIGNSSKQDQYKYFSEFCYNSISDALGTKITNPYRHLHSEAEKAKEFTSEHVTNFEHGFKDAFDLAFNKYKEQTKFDLNVDFSEIKKSVDQIPQALSPIFQPLQQSSGAYPSLETKVEKLTDAKALEIACALLQNPKSSTREKDLAALNAGSDFAKWCAKKVELTHPNKKFPTNTRDYLAELASSERPMDIGIFFMETGADASHAAEASKNGAPPAVSPSSYSTTDLVYTATQPLASFRTESKQQPSDSLFAPSAPASSSQASGTQASGTKSTVEGDYKILQAMQTAIADPEGLAGKNGQASFEILFARQQDRFAHWCIELLTMKLSEAKEIAQAKEGINSYLILAATQASAEIKTRLQNALKHETAIIEQNKKQQQASAVEAYGTSGSYVFDPSLSVSAPTSFSAEPQASYALYVESNASSAAATASAAPAAAAPAVAVAAIAAPSSAAPASSTGAIATTLTATNLIGAMPASMVDFFFSQPQSQSLQDQHPAASQSSIETPQPAGVKKDFSQNALYQPLPTQNDADTATRPEDNDPFSGLLDHLQSVAVSPQTLFQPAQQTSQAQAPQSKTAKTDDTEDLLQSLC